MSNRPTTGMVLGKFMPPHLGHKYLVDFARSYVDRLTVVVGSLEAEPIPGDLRFQWMRRLFPGDEVLHLTDENPQYPHEHPDFWQIWHDSLRRLLPTGPDYVFASEEYGWKLAEILGAKFVPVDISRDLVPVSGTAVRTDPLTNWEYLPHCVRPYFLKRVCVFGPESTGKSTLAAKLARHFHTRHVGEYARVHLEARGGGCTLEDMEPIARGQIASEKALEEQANRLLFCDTDVLATKVWSEALFGEVPAFVEREAESRSCDLYLLCDVDVPWVEDSVRYLPKERESFFTRCEEALSSRNRRYVVIRGSWEDRFEAATRAVEELIGAR